MWADHGMTPYGVMPAVRRLNRRFFYPKDLNTMNIQTLHFHKISTWLNIFYSLVIMRQRNWLCKKRKFSISNILTHVLSISHTKLSMNLELIHRPFLENITIWKKVKKIWTLNISEIYGQIILPKEIHQKLSKIYLYKEFWSDQDNFTPVIVGHTKLIFFSFFNFFLKSNQRNKFIFSQFLAIYILHYRDFSQKPWP